MNKMNVIERVSQISNVEPMECNKVLEALELVLSEELKSSRGIRYAFDKISKLMDILKK